MRFVDSEIPTIDPSNSNREWCEMPTMRDLSVFLLLILSVFFLRWELIGWIKEVKVLKLKKDKNDYKITGFEEFYVKWLNDICLEYQFGNDWKGR